MVDYPFYMILGKNLELNEFSKEEDNNELYFFIYNISQEQFENISCSLINIWDDKYVEDWFFYDCLFFSNNNIYKNCTEIDDFVMFFKKIYDEYLIGDNHILKINIQKQMIYKFRKIMTNNIFYIKIKNDYENDLIFKNLKKIGKILFLRFSNIELFELKEIKEKIKPILKPE